MNEEDEEFIELVNICFRWIINYVYHYFGMKYTNPDIICDKNNFIYTINNKIIYNMPKRTFTYNNKTLTINNGDKNEYTIYKIFYYIMAFESYIEPDDEEDLNNFCLAEHIDLIVTNAGYYTGPNYEYIDYDRLISDIKHMIDKLNEKYNLKTIDYYTYY